MRALALCLMALLLAACAPEAPTPQSDTLQTSDVSVGDNLILTPGEQGRWMAEFTFDTPGTEWVFARSRGDYRTSTWTSQTEGAQIIREDGFDRIRLSAPSDYVRFEFTPEGGPLDRTYDPALLFSDGSVALFLDQFSLLPLSRVADELAERRANPGDIDSGRMCLFVVVNTSAPIIYKGVARRGQASMTSHCEENDGGYVYIGDLPLTEGESVLAVLDPGLPDWLRDTLDSELISTFDALRERFGDAPDTRPVALVAFRGFDMEGLSQSGSVLDGMMVFSFRGDAFKTPNDRLSRYLDWFLTHEATHVYQRRNGQVPVIDQWIVEGHASAMAYAITRDEGEAGAEWVTAQQDEETAICEEALTSQTLRDALTQLPYECGQHVWRALSDDLAADFDALHTLLMARDGDARVARTDDMFEILPTERAEAFRTALDGPGETALETLAP